MKKTLIVIGIIVILIIIGAFVILKGSSDKIIVNNDQENTNDIVVDTEKEETPADDSKTIIGKTVESRDIVAYHYGKGETELLFVGGIHGGYSWNTALVAYELMDYLETSPNIIPDNIRVTVIPALNADGLNKIVGTSGRFTQANVPTSLEATVPGRFNANNVDLNRNFDCDWNTNATWQDKSVSGGNAVFSEPESMAIKNYVETNNPKAVVVWYSAVGGVFASNCHEGVLPETLELTNIYANASGYRAYENFNFYEITGDMVNWLAKKKIPGISVLLTTHEDIEWEKNRKGIEAILNHYAQ